MAELDENPIPSEPGRPEINLGGRPQAVAEAMYSDAFWEQLSEAWPLPRTATEVACSRCGTRTTSASPTARGGTSSRRSRSIRCMDQVERRTVEEDDAAARSFNEAAPRFSPGTTGEYFCTFFPPSDRAACRRSPVRTPGPIVVIGTTGDPATPLDSTRKMAAALEDGRLIVVTADQHTGYR